MKNAQNYTKMYQIEGKTTLSIKFCVVKVTFPNIILEANWVPNTTPISHIFVGMSYYETWETYISTTKDY